MPAIKPSVGVRGEASRVLNCGIDETRCCIRVAAVAGGV
jgi:hypothetical protein